MKIAVISDIHANLEAFRRVLADIDTQQVDEIISLGDIIGYGPDPEEVIGLLRERDIPSVMGNHEYALSVKSYFRRLNPQARESVSISRKIFSDEIIEYLTSLEPVIVDPGADCRFVHGCPPDSTTTYILDPSEKRLAKIFTSFSEKICFAGHTHDLVLFTLAGRKPETRRLKEGVITLAPESRHIVMVGSVGQPRDGNNNAKYVVWDTDRGTIEVRFIPYAIAVTPKNILKKGLPEYNATRLW